jgi:5'-nucleotidase
MFGKFHQRLVLLTTFLLAVSSLISCAPTTQLPAPATKKLTIIGTGDLQGRLDPANKSIRINREGEKVNVVGGISRIAALIKQVRQQTANPVIVLSSGDDLMGEYFQQFRGRAIFSLMETAGYEVLALGNHEFDKGPEVLARALDSISFTPLCSDLKVQNTVMADSCRPYLIRDYGGIRVGFFSLMTEDLPVVTVTGKVKLRKNRAAVAREMVQALRKQGARLIIAVTHIGTVMDRELAAEVDGIDIIFGGHSHNYQLTVEKVNKTLIVNGGEKGGALVRLDVVLDKNNRIIPASADYVLIPVTADIEKHAAVAAQLTQYRKQLPEAIVVGRTEKEWDLSRTALRSRESAVADMVTDMIRRQFAVDIVLFNSGSFRGKEKYSPGPVTNIMLTEIDEFETNVYLLTMQGKYIPEILEHSATLVGQGGFLQVSGIRFTIDTKAPAQQLLVENKAYLIHRPGRRIHDVTIQSADGSWQPLDPMHNYQLATNGFLAELKGDHYFWFSTYGSNIHNTYLTMGAIMSNYFHNNKVVNPVQPDGRITFKGALQN